MLGARQDDDAETTEAARARAFVPRRDRPRARQGTPRERAAARAGSAAAAARSLSLERKVAQLFLVGFEGTDLNAEVFERLRRLDLGGIVIGAETTRAPTCSGSWPGRRG